MVRPNCVIVGPWANRMFDNLDPTIGFTVQHTLPKQLVQISDATKDFASMYEVKVVFWVGPRQVEIVNLEGAVGRDEGGLNGGEIRACHGSGRVIVCHITVMMRVSKAAATKREDCSGDTLPRCPCLFRGREFFAGSR